MKPELLDPIILPWPRPSMLSWLIRQYSRKDYTSNYMNSMLFITAYKYNIYFASHHECTLEDDAAVGFHIRCLRLPHWNALVRCPVKKNTFLLFKQQFTHVFFFHAIVQQFAVNQSESRRYRKINSQIPSSLTFDNANSRSTTSSSPTGSRRPQVEPGLILKTRVFCKPSCISRWKHSCRSTTVSTLGFSL